MRLYSQNINVLIQRRKILRLYPKNHKPMKKRTYKKPELKSIRIDNQISMVMMSEAPPTGPNESLGIQQTSSVDPYKISKA